MVKKRRKVKVTGKRSRKTELGIWFLLSVVLVFALVMRLYQPDWYSDRQFHPDERWIVSSAVPGIQHWGDKPIGLQYGTLPLYILAEYNKIIDFAHRNIFKRMDVGKARIAGARAFSGIIDTGTIVFIFLLCTLLFNRKIALTASALLAFTVLHIHASHFFTVDTFTAFFAAGTVYFAARIYKKGGFYNYVFAGVFYGAALASKTAALPAAFAVLAAHLLHVYSIPSKGRKVKPGEINMSLFISMLIIMPVPEILIKELYGTLLTIIFAAVLLLYLFRIFTKRLESSRPRVFAWTLLAVAAGITFITFFVSMPHALLDYEKFSGDQNYQRRILVTGEGDVPYNRQYQGTVPYIYYVNNLVKYTMGIPYGTVAVIAFLFYIIMFIVKLRKKQLPDKEVLIILSWMVPYFLIVGMSFAKFNRYMIPMTPFFAVLTAKLFYDLYSAAKSKAAVNLLKFIVIGGAVFYAAAFMNIYFESHPWIQASRWIYKNVPAVTGSPENPRERTTILNEMWGDDLPVYADGRSIGQYRNLKWALQEHEFSEHQANKKKNELAHKLSETDYVMMADRRAYGTYLRLPDKYPINYFYYRTMLFEPEKLGFEKAHETAVYPELFGIKIKDDDADESFQLYDHPHVYVFRKKEEKPRDELLRIIQQGAESVKKEFGAARGPGEAGVKGADNPNMGEVKDRPVPLLPSLSVFMWYVLVQLLALAALPLCFTLFKNFKDSGYGLAKALGIFVFAWVNWILVSFGAMRFYQVNLWIIFAALAGAAGVYFFNNKEKIKKYMADNANHILVNEVVFLAAYMFFIYIKLYCPDIHNVAGHGYNGGGEPMGMAYLSGIFGDVKFPPHDPWLSGFTLNYYYWGQLILATLSKFLGYLPRITYNLSLSLVFALTFISAFSVMYNMTGKYKYGVFSGFLLAMAGNFHALEFIYDGILKSGSLEQVINNVFRFQFIWDATRVYPHPVITEMPFFSYLYGDLHAHNIVIPFTVLAAAVVLNVMKQPNKTMNPVNSLGSSTGSKITVFFMLALLLGSMMAINTWNFPPLVLLITAALTALFVFLVKSAGKPKPGGIAVNWLVTMAVIAGAAALAYALFMPFHMNFVSPYKTAVNRMKETPVDLYTMFKFFSVFFFIILAYVYFILDRGLRDFNKKTGLLKIKSFDLDSVARHINRVFDKITGKASLMFTSITAAAVIMGFIYLALTRDTFAFLFIVAVVTVWMMFKSGDNNEIFALSALFISIGMIWGTELFMIADGRMNTVFKFYMVAWTLLGISVPYLFYLVVKHYSGALKSRKKHEKQDRLITAGIAAAILVLLFILRDAGLKNGKAFFEGMFLAVVIAGPLVFFILKNRTGKLIMYGAFAAVMLPVLLYPFMGAFIKMSICSRNFEQKPRIDGMAYMEKINRRIGAKWDFDKYDAGAINWINENLNTITPVLEAPGERMYSGLSRISIFTGMPAVVGWGYQVGQQSGRGADVSLRNSLTNRIYRTQDKKTAAEYLEKFNTEFVYVGNIEKALYGEGVNKFAEMGIPVYRNEEAVLYRIKGINNRDAE